jgi:diguanylate cyclase (GGDEF)-like protein/PAS domain S-box-containing protein
MFATDPVLNRLVDAIGLHVFIAEVRDGEYVEVFTGPGVDDLLGGPTPPGIAPDDAWPGCVHPEDRHVYREAMDALQAGVATDVEYRLVGFDGVTRWVWERGRPRPGERGVVIDGMVLDVTVRRTVSSQLEDARAYIDRIVAALDEHLYTAELYADGAYNEIYTGPGSERFLGAPPGAVVDVVAAWDERVHPDDRAWVDHVYDARRRGESNEVTYRLRGLDGSTRWVSDRGHARPGTFDPVVVDGIVADVTEQKLAERELHEALARIEIARQEADRRSRIDQLTGAYNRTHLIEAVNIELARASRHGETPALVLVDVDNFKRVNDVFGHLIGDAVLVEVAARLRHAVRAYDTVTRWGGEEFALLLPGMASDDELRTVAEGVRRAVAGAPFLVDELSLALTVSLGASRATPSHDNVQALLGAADGALYRAKHAGRNRTMLASDLGLPADADHDQALAVIADALSASAARAGGRTSDAARRIGGLARAVALEVGLPAAAATRCGLAGQLLSVAPVREVLDRVVGLGDVAAIVEDAVASIASPLSPARSSEAQIVATCATIVDGADDPLGAARARGVAEPIVTAAARLAA